MTLRVFLSALFAFVIINASAQFGKIPPEATNAFKAKYPDAANVSWRSGLNSYKASFEQNSTKYTAEFNSVAQWVKTEGKLTYDRLPSEVADGLHKSMYNGWEHTELLKIEEKDKEVEYRIRVKKNTGITKKYLYFNSAGQLLRESTTI